MSDALGLIALVGYIALILALSMAVTWAVVRISPSESAKERKAKQAST
jgi:flagellar biogenesis protein FliO